MAFPVLWGPCIAAVKISVLFLYLAVFRSDRVFRIATYLFIGLISTFGLSVVVAGLAMCNPIAKQWDPSINGTCGNIISFYLITSAINMAFDLVILVWPIPLLWSLQVCLSQRKLSYPPLNSITNEILLQR